jgi:hypothetical protein
MIRKAKKKKDQKLVQKTVLFAVEILCPESDINPANKYIQVSSNMI